MLYHISARWLVYDVLKKNIDLADRKVIFFIDILRLYYNYLLPGFQYGQNEESEDEIHGGHSKNTVL